MTDMQFLGTMLIIIATTVIFFAHVVFLCGTMYKIIFDVKPNRSPFWLVTFLIYPIVGALLIIYG